MALIVEDGTGLATAESYLSVVDADALIASLVADSTDWDALAEADQEDVLRRSTAWLDETFGQRYSGARRTREQALLFPRVGAIENGWAVPEAEIPSQVQRALAVVAAVVASNPTVSITPTANSSGAVLIAEEEDKVGELSTRTKYAGSGKLDSGSTISELGAAGAAMRRVRDILRPILVPGNVAVRG
ncbi:DnaT-like ssDNA-binding protein [Engelhardtia mirabilis]|uniref:Putative DnaT-like domain-containing protein n=1 Tax=Engelhardtia mirabilis TaxID=2528011 RepID=A0A518BL63_9BACT|nr:hypothetical protein Pla133_27950 [Planctomycetes bacterium Pla133]QDV02033.1 hypothetical protein Pla86_27940 [Planctomycetes bacterium Pla86]